MGIKFVARSYCKYFSFGLALESFGLDASPPPPLDYIINCENLNSFTRFMDQVTVPRRVLCQGEVGWRSEKPLPAIWCGKCREVIASFIPVQLARNLIHLRNTQHRWLNCTRAFKSNYFECSDPTNSRKSPQSNRTWVSQVHSTKYSSLALC